MAAQATEQTIRTHQLRGSIADSCLDQSAGTLSTIAHRLLRNILWAQHHTGLLHKLGILPKNIAHSGIVDLLKLAHVLCSLDKGRSVPAHISDHDLDTRFVASFNDRLCLLARQAHGFLNQDMFALVYGSEGRIGMIFIAVQHEDRLEVSLASHVMIVSVTVFGRYYIALPHGAEQFLRDIADGGDFKPV